MLKELCLKDRKPPDRGHKADQDNAREVGDKSKIAEHRQDNKSRDCWWQGRDGSTTISSQTLWGETDPPQFPDKPVKYDPCSLDPIMLKRIVVQMGKKCSKSVLGASARAWRLHRFYTKDTAPSLLLPQNLEESRSVQLFTEKL
ncbi:hypothetical protein Fmac_022833 [Flemingia macrophylla]|uniref:Uncharacterized protein n=1 Tax=Flemingia macrophylla TaxID=520843 RepID=A0ABD1M103_9FABA